MTDLQDQLRTVETNARRATAKARPWIIRMARAGYVARGVTYLLTGSLATLAAVSYAPAGRAAGPVDTLLSLLSHPFGWLLLGAIAAGFLGYAAWCLVVALADADRLGHSWPALRLRFTVLCRGLAYVALAALTAGALVGVIHANLHADQTVHWTRRLMSLPAGIWLVAIVGASVAVTGLSQLRWAWRPTHLDRSVDFSTLSPRLRTALVSLGRFGMAARGLVFLLIGTFMLLAAYHANPHDARNTARALRFLQHQPAGPCLLALVSLGLTSFGLFQFVLARYRRLRP